MRFNKQSFWSLISSPEIKSITIPIIQRAYTQGGRGGDEVVRSKGQRFVTRLVAALRGEPLLLDFIYGSLSGGVMSPLDGQQRLTTLFLLHWYVARREGKLDAAVSGTLRKFAYETRVSARDFCAQLSMCDIPSEAWRGTLSATIRNQRWFMLSWLADPSVESMLGMLDMIDAAMSGDTATYWDALTGDVGRCPVTFCFTSLEEMGLTDDLYIKMNARGLELTPFEKFKAAFNSKVDKCGWDAGKAVTATFAHRIDTVWTDLFWGICEQPHLTDRHIQHFVAAMAMNHYAKSYRPESREQAEQRIQLLAGDATTVNPYDFTEDAYAYLTACLDAYVPHGDADGGAAAWEMSDGQRFLNLAYKDKMAYPDYVLLFAQTEYLMRQGQRTDGDDRWDRACDDWQRVVNNIVRNSTIDSPATFVAAITLVGELAEGCGGIYPWLATHTVNARHAGKQVRQEILKARIIVADDANCEAIHATEDTAFCQGDIGFPLYCIGCDAPDNFDRDRLQKLQEIIASDLDPDAPVTDDFKRAMLTVGGNDYYNVWGSWSYNFGCAKRWLLDYNEDLYDCFASNDYWRTYLRDLLLQRMEMSYAGIADSYAIPDGMPRWKAKLIKGKSKIDGATYILIPDDQSYCLLSWQQRPKWDDQVKKVK